MRPLSSLRGVALAAPALALAALLGCSGGEPAKPATPACDLTVDTLAGKTFLMLEAQADKSEVPNPQARLRFVKEGDALIAKYTVKSLGNVYDYFCERLGDKQEVACKTKHNVAEACRAIDIHQEGSCSKAKIEEITGWTLDAKDEEAIAAAKKELGEARASQSWERYKAMHHHLGNAVQGVVYAKVDTRRCRLQIDDMMKIVYQHDFKEDFNPVGTNPFVGTDDTYLFEDCPEGRVLADLTTPELPPLSEIPPERIHQAGQPVHYWYVLSDDSRKAAEGCTYAADLYVNWRPFKADVTMTVTDGKIAWHVEHSYAAEDRIKVAGTDGAVFHMVRTKTCGGEKSQIDVTCNVARVEN